MITIQDIRQLLRDVLQLGDRVNAFGPGTRLLGSIPEFDSMAVVGLIAMIEDRFGVSVDDDEISADSFETVGTLMDFVNAKLAA